MTVKNNDLILREVSENFSWPGKIALFDYARQNPHQHLNANIQVLYKAHKEGILFDILPEQSEAVALNLLKYEGDNPVERLKHLLKVDNNSVRSKPERASWVGHVEALLRDAFGQDQGFSPA